MPSEMNATNVARHGADVDAVVVGAGFSGLYMTHKLRNEMGLSVRGIEAGSGPGGVWYWNRYPGAHTDSLHSIYRFTFDPALIEEWSFDKRYPSQQEVHRYLEFVADRLDLRRSFTFNSRVVSMHYDEDRTVWTVTTDTGETITSTYVITGIGLLTAPNLPSIKNLDSFQGERYFAGKWPEKVDLAGKRVGLIGTGSTGIQILPMVAEEAAHVSVFQRTPNYVLPAQNRPLTQDEKDEARAHYREIAQHIRQHPFAMRFTPSGLNALDVDAATRKAVYEEGWKKGGFYFMFETFDDIQINEAANETACEFIREKIREIVKDPETAEKLTPRGYPLGAKRPPAGTNYYESFNRENVTLVDISNDPIVEATRDGLRTESAEFDFDVLIFATGFDASTGAFIDIDIRGRDGMSLSEKWENGPLTNLGLSTAGFPNLLMITGPLAPFANLVPVIEEAVDWIAACIAHLRKNGLTTIESSEAAEQAWAQHATDIANMLAAGKGESVHTWFAGANVDGKTHAINVYFGGANAYIDAIHSSAENDFDGFVLK